MRLFKHKKQNQAQKIDPSDSEAIPVHHRLKRLLGKKRSPASGSSQVREERSGDGSVNLVLGSHPPSNHEDSPTIKSLWDRAYDTLGKDNRQLVEEYEKLLSKEAQKTGTHQLRVIRRRH
jgi:hypothetical protein